MLHNMMMTNLVIKLNFELTKDTWDELWDILERNETAPSGDQQHMFCDFTFLCALSFYEASVISEENLNGQKNGVLWNMNECISLL